MSSQNKSVLDDVPVRDEAFPFRGNVVPVGVTECQSEALEPLVIVGSCPYCGAPIYGKKVLPSVNDVPPMRYSCRCWRREARPTLESTAESK